jgi:hypothetical protein
MKRNLLLFSCLFLFITISFGQEAPKFGIKFTGFVKNDIYFDSRQTVSIRDGQFLLYPAEQSRDMNGIDVNARSSFNIISIQTRLRGNITGPDAFGAKTSGAIEGEFFGHAEGQINEFRLRHAYVKIEWENTQLLVGQYWHPMFIETCFPGTISFNTGVPFLPFSRNPQIRLTQKFGKLSAMFTALSQRDFTSTGPDGPDTKYLRNAVLPNLNLRVEYHTGWSHGHELLGGASVNYKQLLPQLKTPANYISDQTVSSISWMVYLKYALPVVEIKAGFTHAQDAYDLTMIGGYAICDTLNATEERYDYTPYKTAAAWGDFETRGEKWKAGLFVGYTKNLGATNDIAGTPYVRGTNIDYVYRISPRVIFNSGKFRIAPEIEYTLAAYMKTNVNQPGVDEKGKITHSEEIGNLRLLLGVYFFF